MKREVDLEYETIGFDRPTSFVCRGRNGRTTATDRMSFTRDGDRTQINYRAEFDFPFPVNVLVPLMIRRKLEKLADETVEQIKRTLDVR